MSTTEPPRPLRFRALDALRGVCAIMVCLYHANSFSPLTAVPLVRMSWQFVDFFFVLSGFVIAASYRRRLREGYSLRAFMVLRVGRIYPLHLAVLAAFVVVELAVTATGTAMSHAPFTGIHSVAAIFSNLTLTQSFGLDRGPTWNYPSWSISTEFWTYLLFGVAALGLWRRLDLIVAATAATCGALLWATNRSIETTYNLALLRCLYGFAVGVIAFATWQRFAAHRAKGRTTLVELAAVVLVAAFVVRAGPTPWNLLDPFVFAAAILVFAHEGGRVSRGLMTGPAQFLGRISFAIYMVHALVFNVVGSAAKIVAARGGVALTTTTIGTNGQPLVLLGATATQGTLFVVAQLGVIVGVATITNRLIEQPGQRWSRQWVRRAVTERPSRHAN